MEKQKTWIRVAGHAANIKASKPYGWRCFIKGDLAEIPLKDWHVIGMANHENFIPGFSSKGDEHGLVAWIDCFGSYTIENDILHIIFNMPIS